MATCKTGFWSGATKTSGRLLHTQLSKAEATPLQTTCPISAEHTH